MTAAEDRAEIAEQSMARLQQLQEQRQANSVAALSKQTAGPSHGQERQTPASDFAEAVSCA